MRAGGPRSWKQVTVKAKRGVSNSQPPKPSNGLTSVLGKPGFFSQLLRSLANALAVKSPIKIDLSHRFYQL